MEMCTARRESLLAFLMFACVANCEIIFSEFSTDMDQCRDVCSDSFFQLPKDKEAQDVCQRGCRFFNIIYLKDDHDLNTTKEECYLSCSEAYDADRKKSCNTGCTAMSKKKQSELSSILVIIEQDNPKNIMMFDPELEMFESEIIISDPLVQSQIEIGYNVEYKIPETKVRTMPIEKFVAMTQINPSGDWLDCASRNSGIPKWILLTAILSAILVALWLSISSEKRVMGEEMLIESDDGVEPEKGQLEKEELQKEEVEFSCPPKYSIETEKV